MTEEELKEAKETLLLAFHLGMAVGVAIVGVTCIMVSLNSPRLAFLLGALMPFLVSTYVRHCLEGLR